MEIKKAATAGTLESSDCMVTVEPGEGKIDFSLESSVIHQYGNQLRKVVSLTGTLPVLFVFPLPPHVLG